MLNSKETWLLGGEVQNLGHGLEEANLEPSL